jgi:hypothetical protein
MNLTQLPNSIDRPERGDPELHVLTRWTVNELYTIIEGEDVRTRQCVIVWITVVIVTSLLKVSH